MRPRRIPRPILRPGRAWVAGTLEQIPMSLKRALFTSPRWGEVKQPGEARDST
jgi:hypothetical protein